MRRKRILQFVFIFLVPLVLVFSQCLNSKKPATDPRGEQYAGSAACMKCHSNIAHSFLHTAHYFSTRTASATSIGGSLNSGSNAFIFNDSTKMVVEKKPLGIYQTAYLKGKKVASERIDIVFGGAKAETYLYWKGNKTYQLPLSYFNALHSWTNSPGYTDNQVDYGRLIGMRCFECHSSYIKQLPFTTQSLHQEAAFDKSSLIMGIDCERCHGPGANHVNFHTQFPEQKKARYMVSYQSLSRSQRVDMCAVCHSGNKSKMLQSTFDFVPGDTLDKFKEPDFLHSFVDSAKLDVHGNQTQMLEASKCFIKSKMDCATCHNVHVAQRGNMVMYTQRCLSCHNQANHNFCKMAPVLGEAIKTKCIDCHMPAKPSNVIVVQTAGKGDANPYMVRSHHIAIYPEESRRIMAYLKTQKTTPLNVVGK